MGPSKRELEVRIKLLDARLERLYAALAGTHRLTPSEYRSFKEMEKRAFTCLECHDEGGRIVQIPAWYGIVDDRQGFCPKCGVEVGKPKKKK